MKSAIPLDILAQPDGSSCGPTCLHTIYSFYGDEIPLAQVIGEVEALESGGTLGCMLANHALGRGYDAVIYTYNLNLFDPTWFQHETFYIKNKLKRQARYKHGRKLAAATKAYSRFLDMGGILKYEELKPSLIRGHLDKGTPLLAGLSSTHLYGTMREFGPDMSPDDLRGEATGHFVVLNGYDKKRRKVLVADPLHENPMAEGQRYETGINRLINAILLGIITYDANIIVITPKQEEMGQTGS